jgi:hypothetical protein
MLSTAFSNVADPDPSWIPGIRIRIQEGKNDPQQKKKCKKIYFLKCWWMFSLRAESLLM